MSNSRTVFSKLTAARQAMELDDDGWQALRYEISELFTPGPPIDELDLFAGRKPQIQKLQDVVASKGRHAVIYGERGVGKTSLANIFFKQLGNGNRAVKSVRVQCDKSDTFESLWHKIFKRIKFTINGEETWADEIVYDEMTPDMVQIILSNFSLNDIPIIIVDEFDRIRSDDCKSLISDTLKHLSDYAIHCTIIIVGVAESVTELIAGHQSVSRALVQVRMPRMNSDELKEIVTKRLNRTQLKISDDALWRISFLSHGLPFYAHALGKNAAIHTIENKGFRITEKTIDEAIVECVSDIDQLLIDKYVRATVETRKGNIFKQVIAACALADQDDLGRFSAVQVAAPLSDIVGKEMKAPAFSFHLNGLCQDKRGEILQKTGVKSHFRFRFIEPVMQPYITMRSLSDGIIDNNILDNYAIQRQKRLPI